MGDIPAIAETSTAETESLLSASAIRMRRSRERRRRGVLSFRIELSDYVINELIRRKRLAPDYRARPNGLGEALERYLRFMMC